jgi:ribosomal protein S18 acetylase RimI-like enzyme
VEKYFAELAVRFSSGFDPAISVSANDDEVSPPRGVFLLVRFEGAVLPEGAAPPRPIECDSTGPRSPSLGFAESAPLRGSVVGCGAMKTLEPGVAEIKRMWVDPSVRRRGIGRKLLAALEEHALAHGCHTVRLDTAAPLREAIGLYSRAGYTEIAPYNANPYAAHWFEKRFRSSKPP